MNPRERSFGRNQYLLRVRLRIRILIRVQLLRQFLYVHHQPGRVLRFHPQQFTQTAVQLVPDVARPPRRAPFRHETREEHAVQHPRGEVAILQVPLAQEGRLVEGDHRLRVDPDDGEAAPVALQELGERPHEDGADLLVQHDGLGGAHRKGREGVVGTAQLGLED